MATVSECAANQHPEPGKFCPFNFKDLIGAQDACNRQNDYGYKLGNPCVLIKLNRIYGWNPEPFKQDAFPKDMPKVNVSGGTDGIFITCEGENPADKENIGPLRFAPSQLIKSNYFPYTNQPGYLSPFVMVHFMQPARGVLINIECKAWAKNINHDRQDREGSVHFELLID